MGRGFLKINFFVADNALAVGGVRALVKDMSGNTLYDLIADESGVTEEVSLETQDKEYSVEPCSDRPRFSVYDVEVPFFNGYQKVIVHGVQIFDGELSILPIQLHPAILGDSQQENTEYIYIPLLHGVDEPRAQFQSDDLRASDGMAENGGLNVFARGDPPAVAVQAEPIPANEVRIPTYITVHLGSPNAAARNVRIPFVDYIKNVASSEIFPTWEEAALYANIYSQISFALNRVYTVWYRSRGFDFDITNNTAFDQYFVEGRNIFGNISRIVDEIFNNFLRRPGRREPFFAAYCNGTTATCNGLSQWGSQNLALNGYTPIQILRYYFPNDIQIVESTNFTSDVGTFGGVPLREGSTGEDVRTMQTYLNRISGNFYIPPAGMPDGVFGSSTGTSTSAFQRINNLIPDAIIGKSTWYAITKIYVAVRQLAELTSEGERISIGAAPPNVTINVGDRGEYVTELQFLLNFISEFFPAIPFVIEDGVYREATKRAVTEFQKEFGLTPDGVVGPATWNKLYDVYKSIQGAVEVPPSPPLPPAEQEDFPGTPLRIGSRGDSVLLMQKYLNEISKIFPVIPRLAEDGVFGTNTQAAATMFQWLFGLVPDGVIGESTWNEIVRVYHSRPDVAAPQYPGQALRVGSRGNDVNLMQRYLNTIAQSYTSIPGLAADGVFGPMTERSVMEFQRLFGLTVDGVIGPQTWNTIVSIYNLLNF